MNLKGVIAIATGMKKMKAAATNDVADVDATGTTARTMMTAAMFLLRTIHLESAAASVATGIAKRVKSFLIPMKEGLALAEFQHGKMPLAESLKTTLSHIHLPSRREAVEEDRDPVVVETTTVLEVAVVAEEVAGGIRVATLTTQDSTPVQIIERVFFCVIQTQTRTASNRNQFKIA